MPMWYPRNDTYPEFGPQRTTRKGPFFASLNEQITPNLSSPRIWSILSKKVSKHAYIVHI